MKKNEFNQYIYSNLTLYGLKHIGLKTLISRKLNFQQLASLVNNLQFQYFDEDALELLKHYYQMGKENVANVEPHYFKLTVKQL